MNLLRRKLASFLMDSSQRGINALDANSPCTAVLERTDVESILAEDIRQICKTASYAEITKILCLAAWMKSVPKGKRQGIKGELKRIAEGIVARTEMKCGKLRIPDSFRHLLLNL